MSVSNIIDDLTSSLPSNPPLPLLSEPLGGFSFADSDLFLQESTQVETKTCATSVISGLAASIFTKNPVPFLIGCCGCLPSPSLRLTKK